MRVLRLILIIVFALSSCKERSVRDIAKKNDVFGPVNRILTMYMEYNYHYPSSINELVDFCESCDDVEWSSFVKSGERSEFIRYLMYEGNEYIQYQDSCFFFSPIDNTGCCEYGNPTEIINSPWDFRTNEFHTFCGMSSASHVNSLSLIGDILQEAQGNSRDFVKIRVSYKAGAWSNDVYEKVQRVQETYLRLVFIAERDGGVKVLSKADDLEEIVIGEKIEMDSDAIIRYEQYLTSKMNVVFSSNPELEQCIFVSVIPVE